MRASDPALAGFSYADFSKNGLPGMVRSEEVNSALISFTRGS